MPWNDLYATARLLEPGIMAPPAIIQFSFRAIKRKSAKCSGSKRNYFACNPLGGLIYVNKLYKRNNRQGKCLVVHIHNPTLSWLALIIKVLCPKIVIVGNLHNDWGFLKLHHRIGMHLLAKTSHHLICVSKASKDSIPARLSKELKAGRRISVIQNGIDSDKFRNYVANQILLDSISDPPPKKIAVVVARMVEQKNCFFLLDIVAQTKAIDHLIWFGDGSQRNEIVARIKMLGIESRVSLRGNRKREEIFKELSGGALYLAASKWEGIGVANLEAAALGCPIYLSEIPPHIEIAKILGISTYPLNDVNAWTNAITNFIKSSNSRTRSNNLNIAKITQDHFSLNKAVKKYIDIYRSVCGQVHE